MGQEQQGAPEASGVGQDDLARSRLELELARLRLERQKASIELLLKRRELKSAPGRQWKDIFANPLTLAIVGGFVTLMTTTIAGHYNAADSIDAEKAKARQALQADLIKKFVDNPDPQKVRANLHFLVDVGLVGDYADRLQSFLDKHPDSALPTASTLGPSALQDVHSDDDAIDLVMRLEGGYVEDPADPTSASNFGIVAGQLSEVDGHPASKDDIRNLSADKAREIYRKQYLTGATSGITSVQVKAAYLGLAVNNGVRRAVSLFETAISTIDHRPIAQDGILGPVTVQRINAVDPDTLIETANCEAAKYYEKLPTFNRFGTSWMRRLRMFSPVTLKGVCPELQTGTNGDATAGARP